MDGMWVAGLPLWGELIGYVVAAAIGVAGGGFWFYPKGEDAERERTAERIEHDRAVRRNALTDRGRTTDQYPEHDDAPSRSRSAPVRIVGTRPTTADRLGRRL
jgi:hypothetical protein